MGCCGDSSVAPEKEPYGPIGRRRCTDVLFLLLFVSFWIGMLVIAYYAVQGGNPSRLVYGVDMYGNVCGRNNKQDSGIPDAVAADLTDKPVLYWANPLDLDIQWCVKECPSETKALPDVNGTSVDLSYLVCDYDVTEDEKTVTNIWHLISAGRCFPPYKSSAGKFQGTFTYRPTSVLNRCIPTEGLDQSQEVVEEINARELSSQVIADLFKSWPWILAGVGVAVGLGFLWLILMRIFSGIIVWLTIFVAYAALFALTFWIWIIADRLNENLEAIPEAERVDSDERNATAARVFAYILVGISVIMLLLLVWMRKRIQLAIGIIKEATKAIATMPSIIAFPGGIFLMMAAFYVYWTIISFFLSTSGVPVYQGTTFRGFDEDNTLRGMQIYHFFGFLWTTQFIVAIGQTTIAGAIASWYWVVDKSDMPTFPVLSAFWRVIRYHLGSMAFGSLIIAIVKFIRAILKWLQKRLKGTTSKFLVFFLKCLDCCFACFERFLKYINKNAYIMIAVKGDGFCKSAQRAFTLILSNILRVGAVGVISTFLLFLGKLFICLGATLFGIYFLYNDQELSFWIIPALLIAILSYFVASAFMNVYDMAIDTILLSFCEDADRNDGSVERPYYMSESLREFIEGSHKCCGCCG